MLELAFVQDADVSDPLEDAVWGDRIKGGKVVLTDNGVPCGVAVFNVSDCIELIRLGILPDKRGQGRGDFFSRALIFKLSLARLPIKITFKNDYFTRLGFRRQDDIMYAEYADIVFKGKCKGENCEN